MNEEADYLRSPTADLYLAEGLEPVRDEFPGVVVTATIIQSNSGPGGTRYAALYRGHAITAYTIPSLIRQLRDIYELGDGA